MLTTTPTAATIGDKQAGDLRWIDQAPDRFVGHQHAEDEQHGAVGLSAQHLGAPHAVREAPSGRPLHEPDHEERQHERAGVGQHVPGVRQERQRVRDDADDDLERHEARR